ncbi:unnamed protein product, partial [Pylaiella littoralis]
MATCLLGYNEQLSNKRLGRQKFSYWGSRDGAAYIRCRRCTNNSPHMRPRSYTRENGERNIPDQGVSGEPQSSRWRSSCTRAAQVCGRTSHGSDQGVRYNCKPPCGPATLLS